MTWLAYGAGVLTVPLLAVTYSVLRDLAQPSSWWCPNHETTYVYRGRLGRVRHTHEYAKARWCSRRLVLAHFRWIAKPRCERERNRRAFSVINGPHKHRWVIESGDDRTSWWECYFCGVEKDEATSAKPGSGASDV